MFRSNRNTTAAHRCTCSLFMHLDPISGQIPVQRGDSAGFHQRLLPQQLIHSDPPSQHTCTGAVHIKYVFPQLKTKSLTSFCCCICYLQIGSPLELNVESTFKLTTLHFVVRLIKYRMKLQTRATSSEIREIVMGSAPPPPP